MIVQGKIVNIVRLADINKNIQHNQKVSLTECEVNKSKDLKNAIKRQWVEVILDKGTAKRSSTVANAQLQTTQQQIEPVTVQQQVPQTINYAEILDMAKKMASIMAEEMLKNNPLVKEMAKEIAKEMLIEIKDGLRIEQHVVLQDMQGAETIPLNIVDKSDNNVFIDFNDEEVVTESNIKDIGTIEIQKDNLSNSLEKMKRYKRSI